MTIRIGVIGCGGRIGGLFRNWDQIGKGVQIVAMNDPRPENIQNYRDKFNCPDAVAVDTYEELVARDDVDWVVIGSYNVFHAEQCVASFKAGKHVFCE
ncbi:MAG: Gfo/Idh/MocA family oxidoreductase, partial [Planctomycetes bacterium]|nr:Gfo/Idh/MocA family oxidoreductase [Planctomycetota bacterium]